MKSAGTIGQAFSERGLVSTICIGFALADIVDVFLGHAGVLIARHLVRTDRSLVVWRTGFPLLEILYIDAFVLDADAIFAAACIISTFFVGFGVIDFAALSIFASERRLAQHRIVVTGFVFFCQFCALARVEALLGITLGIGRAFFVILWIRDCWIAAGGVITAADRDKAKQSE